MKNLGIVLAFFSATTVFAGGLPNEIRCKVTQCASNKWCEDRVGETDKFSGLRKTGPVTLNGELEGIKVLDTDSDTLTIDFSDGGDQFATYSFSKSDLRALKAGKIKSVRGHFKDGYILDTRYVRYEMTLSCKL